MSTYGFGVDVGGSGIKGAVVDLDTGEFVTDRVKIATPQPATPRSVAATVAEVTRRHNWSGPVGITLPAVVRDGVARSAANIDKGWIGTDTLALFRSALGEDRSLSVLNDADAAGIAEVAYGDPRVAHGPVIFLTLGTGVGSALLIDGTLYPNSELGHLEVSGKEAERRAASSVKERKDLSYADWAKQVSKVLTCYERLFSPAIFVVGGGISRKADKWVPLLTNATEVIPASLRNRAGIVGAAVAVHSGLQP